jgi:hypothetical protein
MTKQSIVGQYNAQKADDARRTRMVIEAKETARKQIMDRTAEIRGLVRDIVWNTDRHNVRSLPDREKAYSTVEFLARIGGDDYRDALTVLKFAKNGPAAYADACAVLCIGVNG